MSTTCRFNIWLGSLVIMLTTAQLLVYLQKEMNFKPQNIKAERNRWDQFHHVYQKAKDLPFYVYSAIANFDTKQNTYSNISITVWDGTNNVGLKCCFHHPDGAVTSVTATLRGHQPQKAPLHAKQYTCELDKKMSLPDKVTVYSTYQCVYHEQNFTVVVYPADDTGKFAVCVKTVFGTLNPIRLVEWFEFQHIIGVDKVILTVQDLDKMSMQILEYYERQGYLEMVPFGLPGIPRGFQDNNRTYPQFLHDEAICSFYCQDRTHRYSYVALIDVDEFIVPKEDINLKDLVKNSFLHKWETGAVFTLNVGFFITDWDKTDTRSSLYTVQYTKRDSVKHQCYKNIYIPDRVRPSSLSTHEATPKPGYKRHNVPQDLALLHHYRKCRPNSKEWRTCMTRKRYTDTTILRYQSQLEDRVTRTWNSISGL